MAIRQDADLWLAKLEPGQQVAHLLAPKRHAWVHVAEGEVVLNDQALSGGDAAAVDGGTKLELSADKPSQVLLFDLN
jgi:redox-sensitive bicupin YhaK (pirin superfamily)